MKKFLINALWVVVILHAFTVASVFVGVLFVVPLADEADFMEAAEEFGGQLVLKGA